MNRDAGNLDDARSYAQALRLRYSDDPEIAALSHTLLQGETIRVNGRPPRPEERTTLQVVDGMLRGNRVIAWVFERNGARAGRGAMTCKMAEPGLLIGRWQTTL